MASGYAADLDRRKPPHPRKECGLKTNQIHALEFGRYGTDSAYPYDVMMKEGDN